MSIAAGAMAGGLVGGDGVVKLRPIGDIVLQFGHSIAASMVLLLLTYGFSLVVFGRAENRPERIKIANSLLNLLFLSVGLTGVMILVSDNVVRAFAVLAAIALVRFRVRVDQKGFNSSLMFAILVGMSFGINEIEYGWLVVGIYSILLIITLPFYYLFGMRKPTDSASE